MVIEVVPAKHPVETPKTPKEGLAILLGIHRRTLSTSELDMPTHHEAYRLTKRYFADHEGDPDVAALKTELGL